MRAYSTRVGRIGEQIFMIFNLMFSPETNQHYCKETDKIMVPSFQAAYHYSYSAYWHFSDIFSDFLLILLFFRMQNHLNLNHYFGKRFLIFFAGRLPITCIRNFLHRSVDCDVFHYWFIFSWCKDLDS